MTVGITRAPVVELQRPIERDDLAVRRYRLYGELLPLWIRPGPIGDFVEPQVPRVGKDQAVAGPPAGDRRAQFERRVAGPRLGREPRPRRRLRAAVDSGCPDAQDACAELVRVCRLASIVAGQLRIIQRSVGDDDLRGLVGRDWGSRRTNLQRAAAHD